jgi:hypothetical protein
MGMPPGRGVIVTFTMRVSIVRMAIRVMVMMVVIVVVMIMVIMVVAIVSAPIATVMIVACVGVELIRRSHRGADRGRAVQRPQRRKEGPAFHPQEPQADNDD